MSISKSNWKSLFSNFTRDSKGAIAVYFGLLFVPLALGIGAAVDIARANHTKTSLQAAADAAALAGAANRTLQKSQLEKIVKDYAMANGAPNVVASIQRLDTRFDSAAGTFKVTIRGRMETGLMALAGIKDIDVGVEAVVSTGSRALDLALALDVTGSMGFPMGTGTRLSALKTSASRMLDILNAEKASYSVLRAAVVPFSEYVNVGRTSSVSVTGKQLLRYWDGCVGSRNNGRDVNTKATGAHPVVYPQYCPDTAIRPLTSDLMAVKNAVNNLKAEGATYIPAGVQWGWQVLSEEQPFDEGMNNTEMKRLQGFKYLVVMTDGDNTIAPSYPNHDIVSDTPTKKKAPNDITNASCTAAKADGIQIFTISFMVTNPDTQTMLTSCASEPGMAFDADNAPQLDAAFSTIGKKLSSLRLQK